jgi:hypothetical protein
VQMMVKPWLNISHESHTTLIEAFHIVQKINWGFFWVEVGKFDASWPPKKIPKMKNQWPLIVGRLKGVKRGGNLGLPHPFWPNRTKGLCVGRVKVRTHEEGKPKTEVRYLHPNAHLQVLWCWRSCRWPLLFTTSKTLF